MKLKIKNIKLLNSCCDFQEFYNDPRSRIQMQNQTKKVTNSSDGTNLSFKDKLKMFTHK